VAQVPRPFPWALTWEHGRHSERAYAARNLQLKKVNQQMQTVIGAFIGAGIGAAIAAATHHPAMWLPLGIGIGLAIGVEIREKHIRSLNRHPERSGRSMN
jgi:uncharacterized membrane protein YoaK (UPF0700 family)